MPGLCRYLIDEPALLVESSAVYDVVSRLPGLDRCPMRAPHDMYTGAFIRHVIMGGDIPGAVNMNQSRQCR
jgi:hypothetical protein